MSNTRNLSSAADDQAQQSSMSSSSSTLAMTSSLSSSAATESKEEKNANGREEKHNTSDAKSCNDEMPGPLHNIILGYAGYTELPNMTGGNSSLFHSIKKIKTKELITAIVSGDLTTVVTMIDEDPSLLMERLEENVSIISPSGQKSNNVTPYRAALAVEDTQMAALIKNKMIEQKAGHRADQQYHEQFPAWLWETEEEKRWAPVFTQLTTLTHAIRDAEAGDIISTEAPEHKLTVRENSAVAIALAQFESLLDARLNETVTIGRHFNPRLLLRSYELCEEEFIDRRNPHVWHDPRELLFWQQVIGGIQRRLPVNYAQAFCHGPGKTSWQIEKGEPQSRSLILGVYQPGWHDRSYSNWYDPASRLGVDNAVMTTPVIRVGRATPTINRPSRPWVGPHREVELRGTRRSLADLVSIKKIKLTELALTPTSQRALAKSF